MNKLPPLKFLLAAGVALATVTVANVASAQGIFGLGIELNATGSGATDPGLTLYALNNGGTDRLLPTGSGATLDQTSWLNSPESAPTFDLGTFDPGAGDSLILTGGSMLTFGTGFGPDTQFLNYQVSPSGGPGPGFVGINLPLNQADVNGTTDDNRWSAESQNIDLLTGLAPGTYTLGAFGYANSGGDIFESNGGQNYGASFTVVPEPGTVTMLLGGTGLMLLFRRRRREAARR